MLPGKREITVICSVAESTFLPGLVGVIAIFIRLAGCYLESSTGHSSLRSAPGGYGRLATVPRLILV
jgi:hypothetical protein